jgi:VanZ family protein
MRRSRANLPRSNGPTGLTDAAEERLPTRSQHTEVARGVILRWVAVVLCVALIFILSAQPGLAVPGTFEYRDKLAHVIEYAGLSWLTARAARASWPTAPASNRAILAVLAISALGICDEVFQAGVPGRDSTIYDWAADTIGAVLGQAWGLLRERRGGVA